MLEDTACALTYYLAVFVELTRPNVAVVAVLVSVECIRPIVGAIKAICSRLCGSGDDKSY